MATHTSLRGRRSECEALDRLLDAVRAGESRALVVRGEAGVGKTALLEYLRRAGVGLPGGARGGRRSPRWSWRSPGCISCARRCWTGSSGCRVRSATRWRRRSGCSAGDAPDRFLVGLAVLSLLSEVAEERPLVCVVDDAQWLDRASAQALAFVARRLLAESVALVFAVARAGDERSWPGCRSCVVEGLRDADARALLASVIRGPLDERVRDRIVAETRGNPLALLELPRGLTPAELAGGFGLPDALPLSGRIEESFRRRLEALPADTRRLLLVAAAEPVGDPVLVWRAAERLGIGAEAAAPAAAAGLLELGARVRFRHPLVRSAVYRAASPEERRARAPRAGGGHRSASVDPDRRAWHRAQATPGPTRTSPPSSSARPAARRRAAGWPRRPRSSSGRPS